MKNIKKYIIGIAASICLTQCDVLDVDPTGWYSENVAYSSLENVDLYGYIACYMIMLLSI